MTTPIQQLNNYAQTTLAVGCTSAALTINVTSAAGHPTAGNFMLRIDDVAPATTFEIVEATAVSGTVYTVTRGQEGTTGIAHNAGAFVGNEPTAAMLQRGAVWNAAYLHARMRRAAAQSLANNVQTVLAFDTIDSDSSSSCAVPAGTYTVKIAGLYRLYVRISFSTAAAITFMGVGVFKNGAALDTLAWQSFTASSANPTVGGETFVPLAIGDVITAWAWQTTGTAQNTAGTCVMYVEYRGPA